MTHNGGCCQPNTTTRWGADSRSNGCAIVPLSNPPHLYLWFLKVTGAAGSSDLCILCSQSQKSRQGEFILIILFGVFTNKHMQEVDNDTIRALNYSQ